MTPLCECLLRESHTFPGGMVIAIPFPMQTLWNSIFQLPIASQIAGYIAMEPIDQIAEFVARLYLAEKGQV